MQAKGMLVEKLVNQRIRMTPVIVLKQWPECNRAQVKIGNKKYYVVLSDIKATNTKKQ